MKHQAFLRKIQVKSIKVSSAAILLGTLETHFSAYMRMVAFIITSNKHTLSLFLTSKDSLI